MLSEIWYTESGTRSLKYSYEYTDDGQVYKFTDHTSGKATVYRYDNVGKLLSFSEYDVSDAYHDFSLEIYYDPYRNNNVGSMFYNLNYTSTTPDSNLGIDYFYTRNPDGIITKTRIHTTASDGWEEFTYDAYGRVTKKEIYHYIPTDSEEDPYFDNEISYSYKSNSDETTTSALVNNYTSKINDTLSFECTYTYDNNGNITEILYGEDNQVRYTYDELGQLIREDNQFLNATYLYEYDNAGNITAVKTCNYTTGSSLTVISTNTYTYSDGAWGDLLMAFNGASITYDGIGNPLIYNNGKAYTFTWNGRQLVGATKGGKTYSFTYNDNGYRTSKTVNGVTTTYYLNGSMIMAEETQGNMTVYLYDSAGLPIGMQYHKATDDESTWEIYWFEKNLQGDIVAVYNESGTKLVSYKYDAWGNFTTIYFNSGYSTKAKDNPFTYRGYYYDRDLELYYLGSRYYDSRICRFINPDKVMASNDGTLGGNNLFAYCFNNPVMFTDESGNWPKWIKTTYEAVRNWIVKNIVDPVTDVVNNVIDDIENYDSSNTKEATVLASNYFSSYNGTFVIKLPIKGSFSFGIIVLGSQTSPTNLQHEYGHKLQLDEMGWGSYITDVALPSVTAFWLDDMGKLPYDYYGSPWEAEADQLGGVNRTKNNSPWPYDAPKNFWELIPLFWS